MFKICSRCNVEKPIKKFKKDKRRVDGRTITCRKCYEDNKLEKFIRTSEQIESQRNKLLGRKYTLAHRLAISEGQKKYSKENKHIFSKDGIPHKEADRKCLKYEIWRQEVFSKKGRNCEICTSTEKLHVHHIKGFHKYPNLRFDVDNGQILCITCHMRFHSLKQNKDLN